MPDPVNVLQAEAEEEQARDWRDELKENWAGLHMGHAGMMLEKVMRQNEAVFDLAERARDGTMGQPRESGDATPEEREEMGVNIGNKTFNTYTMPRTETTTTTPAPAPASKRSKAGMIAALVAAGIGLPIAGALINEWFDNDAVVAPANPGTDTDTYVPYDFGIE